MNRLKHRISLSVYSLIVVATTIWLTLRGFSFYEVPICDRYFHPDYALLKPSGLLGHGLGIVGTFFILFGIFSYMVRKRFRIFSRIGVLKYWLDFHIFLCVLGSILILFHTSFKFGGIVSVGFWSMVIVLASGVLGRYIYLQIPHSKEGRMLSLIEVQKIEHQIIDELQAKYNIDISEFKNLTSGNIVSILKSKGVLISEYLQAKKLIQSQKKINRQIARLEKMQRFFSYWHVAHLPFALILLIIMIIHVAVVLTMGYKWIF